MKCLLKRGEEERVIFYIHFTTWTNFDIDKETTGKEVRANEGTRAVLLISAKGSDIF